MKITTEDEGWALVFYKTGASLDATVMTQLVVNEEESKISRMVVS